MAKGYWIANVDVRNADGCKEYVAALPNILFCANLVNRYVTPGRSPEYAKANHSAAGQCRCRPDRDRRLRRVAVLRTSMILSKTGAHFFGAML
jgi:hypothetical protein